MSEKQMTELNQHAMVEKVVIHGDLSSLNPAERLAYYKQVCESVGLNPLTKPFEYIKLNQKLTLYAKRDATDQLRSLRGISIEITSREKVDDLYIVTARATEKSSGRTDESVGAVNLAGLKGEAAANAIMKAETKSKRRVTLSIAGLGFLDETEISSIPDALPVNVDTLTGEITGQQKKDPTASEFVTVVPMDITRQVVSQSLVCLANGDAHGLKQIWGEFNADEQVFLWKKFDSTQRSEMKKLTATLKEEQK